MLGHDVTCLKAGAVLWIKAMWLWCFRS